MTMINVQVNEYNPRVKKALEGMIEGYIYGGHEKQDYSRLLVDLEKVFRSNIDFMSKAANLDALFDKYVELVELREITFDLLMIQFLSGDAQALKEDYFESDEWLNIEEQTLDRGTEMLNLFLYISEARDENIRVSLEDFLKEFLLIEEDDFQDELAIYEDLIENQEIVEEPVNIIAEVSRSIDEDSAMKDLFFPLMLFFKHPDHKKDVMAAIKAASIAPAFDCAVYKALSSFHAEVPLPDPAIRQN
jgi:hypothetical protein